MPTKLFKSSSLKSKKSERNEEITQDILSWSDTRRLVLEVLLDWEEDQKKNPKSIEYEKNKGSVSEVILKCCNTDMILSILLSTSLLLVGIFPNNIQTFWEKLELASGSISILFSLFSFLLSIQRKIVARNSQNSGLRNSVRAFATFLSHFHKKSFKKRFFSDVDSVVGLKEFRITSEMGTSLTDIYTVYRVSGNKAEWHKVPSLLLVKGDIIALQVGDIAPASVKLLDPSLSIYLLKGERVTLQSLSTSVKKRYPFFLPQGKLQFQAESRQLLDLCNSMRIFILDETPLVEFLKQTKTKHKVPQLHRQIHAIRLALFLASLLVFLITSTIILSRGVLSFETYSSHSSIIITIPLISSLSLLPFISPIILYFIEIWGTCRIMTNIHTFSNKNENTQLYIFFRYFLSALQARFTKHTYTNCQSFFSNVHFSVPPTNSYLLEKLGVVTALALVDDELVCEPFSTPQQLLIPSARGGFKLLDLCPNIPHNDEEESKDDAAIVRKIRGPSVDSDSDSDIEEEQQISFTNSFQDKSYDIRRAWYGLKRYYSSNRSLAQKNYSRMLQHLDDESLCLSVQFEEPSWWKFLPSLKCIGLACMFVNGKENEDIASSTDEGTIKTSSLPPLPNLSELFPHESTSQKTLKTNAESTLLPFISPTKKQQHQHLKLLAQCIGFTPSDLTTFKECKRVHIISMPLLHERLSFDSHALGLTESREWGFLRPDATSVVIQDKRSKSYQLLSIGNAQTIISLCVDSWQGEHSTIVPLSNADRRTIIDTCNNWTLADLDVAAFSYAPVPCTLDQRITSSNSTSYLVDNRSSKEQQQHHYHRHTFNSTAGTNTASASDWNLVANQIFLGVLGSSVSPRKIIAPIIDELTSAGVRFVYFSPRNMRRTKELASQMGIDVAWNCAISLRPLDEGQDDPHRMVSSYADWDVNAKLPHGIENVKEHLEKVDNVPLLVRLYTDVNETSTAEMVTVFQKYHDTVMALGLRHRSRNYRTFDAADFSIGVDVFHKRLNSKSNAYVVTSSTNLLKSGSVDYSNASLLTEELRFISEIASHSCILNLNGTSSLSYVSVIIAIGRAALEACMSAANFFIFGSISISLLTFLCACSVATSIPFVPNIGFVMYTIIFLPLLTFSMTLTSADEDFMNRVPPKNDPSVVFITRDEGYRLYLHSFIRALPAAVAGQIVYLISFGELMLVMDIPALIEANCIDSANPQLNWTSIIRCKGIRYYSGAAKHIACSFMLAEMAFCVTIASASFVFRTEPLWKEPPWIRNRTWFWCSLFSLGLIVLFLYIDLGIDGLRYIKELPWYYFVTVLVSPFLSLVVCEVIKRTDRYHENRAVRYRRLQFETRLGMWSPK